MDWDLTAFQGEGMTVQNLEVVSLIVDSLVLAGICDYFDERRVDCGTT